ncbi:MAG: hypothetical protein KatS3mg119_2053 [Rhodothalassiaceae bacterium]|nr:MAG: hypothetical protein KatS3mg119_2053 [Rhodothalassiaceae bacterium]
MATAPSFDERRIQEALDTARAHHEKLALEVSPAGLPQDTGELAVSAGCVSITVENNQVCLNLPLGIGHYCLPIPVSIPNGTAA